MFNVKSKSKAGHEARSFAHHYGSSARKSAADRSLLRVYPPLDWGVSRVLPHVRRAERRIVERLDALHLTRSPLTL